MSNTRELRRRIKSIKNTSQITKAMQMVAATKMRRAQNQALNLRPYNLSLSIALDKLLQALEKNSHPLLKVSTVPRKNCLVVSTDKSLCGALNTNLFRAMLNFSKTETNLSFYSIGKKGRDFVVKTSKNLQADFENTETPTFKQASQIAKVLIDAFLKNEISESYLAYPEFISTLRQEPRIIKLLPLSKEDIQKTLIQSLTGDSTVSKKTVEKDFGQNEFLLEPKASELLDYVLRHIVQIKIYQALLETKASEHSARMMAMQNATDNAKELVEDLQLSYNQTRQSSITNELLDITSAQAALE